MSNRQFVLSRQLIEMSNESFVIGINLIAIGFMKVLRPENQTNI